MLRIRFHGRGGQGVKTASRLLGTAFFLEGFEVQDAPRYGAERRGAPLFAYVRADKSPIFERGVIPNPDLVMVADDSLIGIPAAGVLQGLDEHAVLAVNSFDDANVWRERINARCRIVVIPGFSAEDPVERPYVSAAIAGAAAALVGLDRERLHEAVRQELGGHGEATLKANVEKALSTYDALLAHKGAVQPRKDETQAVDPGWVRLVHEDADTSAPTIHAAATSVQIKTGLWRTMRPVIDFDHCNKCTWVCGSFCPDGAIGISGEGYPEIDYDHCKGCLVCVAQCPPHAIHAEPEKAPLRQDGAS